MHGHDKLDKRVDGLQEAEQQQRYLTFGDLGPDFLGEDLGLAFFFLGFCFSLTCTIWVAFQSNRQHV